jgi:glycosyltransferase involved in cell wall biosynthesis
MDAPIKGERPLSIVLVLHFPLSRDAGAAGVVLALAEQFRRAEHRVATISMDDMPKLPALLSEACFPFFVAACLLRGHGAADVIEGSTGDCWVYYLLRCRARSTLFVTFSQGLLRPLHDRLMRARAERRAKVSWKYFLWRGSLRLWQEALSIRVADLVYALNSEEHHFATEALGVAPERARVVRNGIGAHFIERARRLRGTPSAGARRRIVQVGSYEDRKGSPTTVAATCGLMRERPPLEMMFLGTVCDAERVYADYPEDLRARVTVLPRFDNTRLPELLETCQLFVMPSTYEAFGLAPLEAMACGLVPVVTNVAGPATYMVDGVNGLVVPIDSPGALSEAIARLLDDDALYAKLRDGAIETALAYDWEAIVRERISDYRSFAQVKLHGGRRSLPVRGPSGGSGRGPSPLGPTARS